MQGGLVGGHRRSLPFPSVHVSISISNPKLTDSSRLPSSNKLCSNQSKRFMCMTKRRLEYKLTWYAGLSGWEARDAIQSHRLQLLFSNSPRCLRLGVPFLRLHPAEEIYPTLPSCLAWGKDLQLGINTPTETALATEFPTVPWTEIKFPHRLHLVHTRPENK